MRPLTLATLLCLAAATVEAKQPKLIAIAIESGSCKLLTILKQNLTDKCSGKLLNTDYSDGRSGFYFVTEDGLAVTFSGIGADQVKPTPDLAIQPIDIVIFGKQHETAKAVGSCKFSNPYHGEATVDCVAETAIGHFAGSFVTDGSEPKERKF